MTEHWEIRAEGLRSKYRAIRTNEGQVKAWNFGSTHEELNGNASSSSR